MRGGDGRFFSNAAKEKKLQEPHPLRTGHCAIQRKPLPACRTGPGSPIGAAIFLRCKACDWRWWMRGPGHAPLTWLCLHGSPGWGYQFRHVLPELLAAGHRVVVPDLPGFGRSDQPKKDRQHSAHWHVQVLAELVQALNLHSVMLLGQGDGGLMGLQLAAQMPERFMGGLAQRCLAAGSTTRQPSPVV